MRLFKAGIPLIFAGVGLFASQAWAAPFSIEMPSTPGSQGCLHCMDFLGDMTALRLSLAFGALGFFLALESWMPFRAPVQSKLQHVATNLVIVGGNAMVVNLLVGGGLLLWSRRVEVEGWGLLNQLGWGPLVKVLAEAQQERFDRALNISEDLTKPPRSLDAAIAALKAKWETRGEKVAAGIAPHPAAQTACVRPPAC